MKKRAFRAGRELLQIWAESAEGKNWSDFYRCAEVIDMLRGYSDSTFRPHFKSQPNLISLECRALLSGMTAQTSVASTHIGIGPKIIASKLLGQNAFVNGIQLTFDQAMDPTSVTDVSRYVVTLRSKQVNALGYVTIFASRTKVVTTHPFLKSATYDPTTNSVALSFAKSNKYGGVYLVSSPSIKLFGNLPSETKALLSTDGTPLGGSKAGGRFSITVGQKQPSSR